MTVAVVIPEEGDACVVRISFADERFREHVLVVCLVLTLLLLRQPFSNVMQIEGSEERGEITNADEDNLLLVLVVDLREMVNLLI